MRNLIVIQLTTKEGTPVDICTTHIVAICQGEVTVVHTTGGQAFEVSESREEIYRRTKNYGVFTQV